MQRANEDGEDVIEDLFGLELQTKHTNKEDPSEMTDMTEQVFKLTC